ncbi:MAG: hypothetical protein R3F14_07940 [Polyangiaceae bacterium]
MGVVPSGRPHLRPVCLGRSRPGTATDALAAAPSLHVHLETGADPQGGSRGAAVRAVREAFDDARTFQRTAPPGSETRAAPSPPPPRSRRPRPRPPRRQQELSQDPVVFHADKASTLLTALSIAAEFGLTPS